MTWYIIGTIIGSIVMATALVFLIIYLIKQKSMKHMVKQIGQSAEDKINNDLNIWAKQTKNSFIPASLYKYSTNKVFEVDSILVTDKALIVIEIKSIKGLIKGDATDLKWQKILGQERFSTTNPIIQNEKHIEHIIKMTDVKVPTISLIIYSNRAFNIEVTNTPGHVAVTRHQDLFDTLDKIDQALPTKINEHDRKSITSMIKKFRTNKREDLKLHKNITTKGGK